MVKQVIVELSDREYQILENIDELEGDTSQKMLQLFKDYLKATPRFRPDYHLIKMDEKKDMLQQVLESIWDEYKSTPSPLENWDEDKFNSVRENLLSVNAVRPLGIQNFILTTQLKKPWLAAFNTVAKIFPDIDEFSQACVATVYMLDYLSRGTFDAQLLKDATILLNELFLFTYAAAKRKAHEFKRSLGKGGVR